MPHILSRALAVTDVERVAHGEAHAGAARALRQDDVDSTRRSVRVVGVCEDRRDTPGGRRPSTRSTATAARGSQQRALLQRSNAVPNLRRALEFERLRGLAHLDPQLLDERRDLLGVELLVGAVALLLPSGRV